MKRFFRGDQDPAFFATLAVALLAGIFLRFYLLRDQVLLDDEWHGLYYVIGKSPLWLLTHFSVPGATCIPLNFYTWLLGATIGWTEMWLRLPSWLCGILSLLICPLLARKIIGPWRAALLALFLAVSPILVFYSRICRPYSAVAFLGFLALLLAARWMQTGALRHGIYFAVAGVLAVYFHLFAAVTVVAPILAAITMHLHSRLWKKRATGVAGPSLRDWLMLSCGMALAGSILILPALERSMRSTFFSVALSGSFELQSLPRVAMLISGTGQSLLALVFWLLVAVGAAEQLRRNPWFGGMLVSLYPLHALALVLSHPDSVQSAIVLARYCIPLVPVSLLFVACGVQAILEFLAARMALRPAWGTLCAVVFIAALVLAGPLRACYAAPNNFTNHGAYQQRYGAIDWSHSLPGDLTVSGKALNMIVHSNELSPFYLELAKSRDSRPVVEYPMMIGDHVNPFYYYQHFHRRPVMVGYASDVDINVGLASGNVYGNTYVDQVLSLVKDQSRLKFRNLVSMDDLAAMRSRNAEYIILHEHFEADLSQVAMPLADVQRLRRQYQATLGSPCYEDANITVFRLSPGTN